MTVAVLNDRPLLVGLLRLRSVARFGMSILHRLLQHRRSSTAVFIHAAACAILRTAIRYPALTACPSGRALSHRPADGFSNTDAGAGTCGGTDNIYTLCRLLHRRLSPGAADAMLKSLALTGVLFHITIAAHHT